MARKSAIHLRVLTTLAVSLVFAILFVVGHHVFYSHLDGRRVDEIGLIQSLNVAIGTAFSVAVRTALSVAICTAYWQLFWELLRSKELRVDTTTPLTRWRASWTVQSTSSTAASFALVPFLSS